MTIDIEIAGGGFWHYVLAKIGSTSILELEKDIYSFFPNPASTEIQINTNEPIDGFTIRDIAGRTLMVKGNPALKETIDVSSLPRGLYLLELRSGNKRATEKFILN